jgi:DNA mismatch endonuclease, patch repair protein
MSRLTPSYRGLRPASKSASAAARGASVKTNTRCELLLRRELWRRGVRYRLHYSGLCGRPDIVFPRQRLVVFCDGDFWHGRDLDVRLARLAHGHNAAYWIAKVTRNVERDEEQTRILESSGWAVIRLWESDIVRRLSEAADRVIAAATVRAVTGTPLRSASQRDGRISSAPRMRVLP